MKALQAAIVGAAIGISMCVATTAQAAYAISLGAGPGPFYTNSVVFDAPAGNNLPTNTWAAQGISSVVGFDTGMASVLNLTANHPWAPNTNVLWSPWGLEITFAQAVTSVSFQGWGNGGNATPFGGGTFVTLKNNDTQLLSQGFTAAWGGTGNTWYNITTTGGDSFNRVVFNSNLFAGLPEQFISQITWTNVPGPGSLALLGLAGVVGGRRRRR